jgi:hypothetical protein
MNDMAANSADNRPIHLCLLVMVADGNNIIAGCKFRPGGDVGSGERPIVEHAGGFGSTCKRTLFRPNACSHPYDLIEVHKLPWTAVDGLIPQNGSSIYASSGDDVARILVRNALSIRQRRMRMSQRAAAQALLMLPSWLGRDVIERVVRYMYSRV